MNDEKKIEPSSSPQDPNPSLDKKKFFQKPIRTFESDLAEALKRKNGSVAAISISESQRKEEMSRAAEMMTRMMQARVESAQPQESMPPKFPPPRSPDASTAIPPGPIAISPNVPQNTSRNEISEEIANALRKAQPVNTARPSAPQVQVPPTPPISTATSVPTPPPPPLPPLKKAPRVETSNVVFETPRSSKIKPIILGITSLALLCAGGFIGYKIYMIRTANKVIPIATPVIIQSVIPNDIQIPLAVGNLTGNGLLTSIYAEIVKNDVPPGNNIELVLNGETGRITGPEFVKRLETNIPSILNRSLTDRFMLGVYSEETGEKTTFVALTTDFFQNAFAGMLLWEDNALADDLALLLNFKERASRDSLSTTSISTYFTIQGKYIDKVIKNRDVREFRGQNDELLFLYSFVNKETLIITTTESAFSNLVDRLEKEAYVR